MKTLYVIECSTGCSCCSDENFTQGFYETKAEAEAQVAIWLSGVEFPLASQYARYGRYKVREVQAEEISNNRIIVEGNVFNYPNRIEKIWL